MGWCLMCAVLYAGYGFIPIPFRLELRRLQQSNLIGGGSLRFAFGVARSVVLYMLFCVLKQGGRCIRVW